MSSTNITIQTLLGELKSQFDLLTSAINKCSSQPYSNDIEKQIKELENTLHQLRTIFTDQNLLGFPGDLSDAANIITKQKQMNESFKQSINQSSISSAIVSKAFSSENTNK